MSKHPIVYRVQPLKFSQLGAVRFHGERRGGDLSHITPPELYDEHGRAAPIAVHYDENGKRLTEGQQKGRDWVKALKDEEREAARFNTAQQVDNLEKRGKHKEAKRRKKEGHKPAYRRNAKGGAPLREVVLSANSAFFAKEGEDIRWDKKTLRHFLKAGTEFLEEEWGPALRYVRIDLDEGAPHIHAVVCHWHEETTKSGARQRMVSPTKHPSYDTERAQDRAGEKFAPLGLRRGDRSAQARREAKTRGHTTEPKRRHVPPQVWRRNEASAILKERRGLEQEKKVLEQVRADIVRIDPDLLSEDEGAKAEAVRNVRKTAKEQQEDKARAIALNKTTKAAQVKEKARKEAIAKAARAKAAKERALKEAAVKAKAAKKSSWKNGFRS